MPTTLMGRGGSAMTRQAEAREHVSVIVSSVIDETFGVSFCDVAWTCG